MADGKNMLMGYDSTIKDYISKYNSEEVTFAALFFKQLFEPNKGTNMIVNSESLVLKYYDELKANKIKIELSESEYMRYRFNPKIMSYDLYGTTELWFLIIDANQLHSSIEFDLKVVYLYDVSILNKISKIVNLEKEFKDYNEQELLELLSLH